MRYRVTFNNGYRTLDQVFDNIRSTSVEHGVLSLYDDSGRVRHRFGDGAWLHMELV